MRGAKFDFRDQRFRVTIANRPCRAAHAGGARGKGMREGGREGGEAGELGEQRGKGEGKWGAT